jgi:hypothetical protein
MFRPYVFELLQQDSNAELLKRIFAFIEDIPRSSDRLKGVDLRVFGPPETKPSDREMYDLLGIAIPRKSCVQA